MKTKLALLTLALSIPNLSFAAPSGLHPEALVTISNDRDSHKTVLSALVNGAGELVGFQTTGGSLYWLKDVEKAGGVPLVERDGYTVITLQGALTRDTQEGRLRANYLANALLGSRKVCEFQVKKEAKGYVIRTKSGQAVSKVHIVTSRLGVKELKGLCP